MKKTPFVLGALTIAAVAASANAAVFPFSVSGTDPDGRAVSATATVDVQATKVVVTLTNTTGTTISSGELLTGFSFTGVTTAGLVINNESANFISVTGGTAADVTAATGFNEGDWTLSDPKATGFSLNFSPQPGDAIIGPSTAGAYPGVVSSITGATHQPFINQTATFELNKPAGFPESITSGTFFFSTNVVAIPGIPGGGSTPEPASLGLLSLGAAGLLLRRRKA